MAKPYTWDEIKSQLSMQLQNTHHIQTYGTIGPCDINHDIDTIITKKPGSPSVSFFKEIHQLFDWLDSYLESHFDARLIRTSRFCDEEEIKYIADCRPADLVFQVMTYVSLKQLKMHWYDACCNLDVDIKAKTLLSESYDCLLGVTNLIFDSKFAEWRNEDLFIRLNDSDRINSHFPDVLLIHRMNVLYDFISRKRLGKRAPSAQDRIGVRKCYYETCELLDS